MSLARAYFSPGFECLDAIIEQLAAAEHSIEICVFTITDNRISKQIIEAKRRGIAVRVITDNDKSCDRGSDIDELERAGIPVRVDQTEHHMHHKYAVFDRSRLITGSYNWTRSAAEFNLENLILTDHAELVRSFTQAFDELWTRLGS